MVVSGLTSVTSAKHRPTPSRAPQRIQFTQFTAKTCLKEAQRKRKGRLLETKIIDLLIYLTGYENQPYPRSDQGLAARVSREVTSEVSSTLVVSLSVCNNNKNKRKKKKKQEEQTRRTLVLRRKVKFKKTQRCFELA